MKNTAAILSLQPVLDAWAPAKYKRETRANDNVKNDRNNQANWEVNVKEYRIKRMTNEKKFNSTESNNGVWL